MKEFKCDQCDSTFAAQFQLRQHVSKKHIEVTKQNQPKITCDECGLILNSLHQLKEHMNDCDSSFKTVPPQVCRFFVSGGCNRGNTCKFSHPEQLNDKEDVPECRNGARCRYLANGVCAFLHRGIGVQQRNRNQKRGYCLYMEDCRRVPYCSYAHTEEDFPKLNKTSKPPIARAASVWQMY